MNISNLERSLNVLINSLGGEVSLYIKFIKTSEEIKINDQKQLPAASLIKIIIIGEFFRQIYQENLDRNKKVKVTKNNRVEGSGIVKLLDENTKLPLIDLVTLMITISDNSATNQLVDLLRLAKIQNYIKSLNLTETNFNHKMMIKSRKGENLTTAYDIAKLLEMLYKNKLPGSGEIIEILKKQQDRGRMPLLLPKNLVIANKTGSLREAVHDVGIIYSKNPYILSFLSDGQKDKTKTKKVLSECALKCYKYSLNRF